MTDWKPGDVAIATVENIPNRVVFRRNCDWAYVPDERSAQGYSCASDHELLVTDVRPLVVIDPEDAEQVARLVDGWFAAADHYALFTARMAAALREFAYPTPPRPDEPTGLGAVVEDTQGARFVRTCESPCSASGPDCHGWERVGKRGEQSYNKWDDIAAVRVLSEGVAR